MTEIGGQRPNVGRLKTPMDEDGQFVLTYPAAAMKKTATNDTEKQRIAEEQQWQARIDEERARIEIERRRLEEEKQLMAQRWELEREKRELEQEKQRMAHEALENRLPEKTAPMEVVALSAPASSKDGAVKICLFPWNFQTIGHLGRISVNERASFNQILRVLAPEPQFSLSHSFYDYEPEVEPAGGKIEPLSPSPEEIDALWQKKSFFSRPEPNPEAAAALAKRFGIDVALFISTYIGASSEIKSILTLIDAGTGEIHRKEFSSSYLSYAGQLARELETQLQEVLQRRN